MSTRGIDTSLPASAATGLRVLSRHLRAVARGSRRRPLGAIGGFLIVLVVLMGTVGPHVAPFDQDQALVQPQYTKPAWGKTLLGTDRFGRDILTRILHGARISLMVAVAASIGGTIIGALAGLIGGYLGGKTDAVIQRIVDVLMSIPIIVMSMALLSGLERSVPMMIVAIGIPMMPYGARVIRASTIVIKETQFVEAARAVGCSDFRIMFRHVAPGCFAPYIVVATGLVGVAIVIEAALGFLGLSVPPPQATWGGMLFRGATEMIFAPHLAIAPGVFITLAVFAFNVVGDTLRDVMDPRLRGVMRQG